MVVIVDLDDDVLPAHPSHASGFPNLKPLHHSLTCAGGAVDNKPGGEVSRPNPNINGFSAALSCYPIVRQLASQLDLNSLHDLSRTCRQFRANLLEYRDQIVKQSLRCDREDADDFGSTLESRLREPHFFVASPRQWTKTGKCARDMVDECQRCGTVVCRNCTIKSPPTKVLRARHRRLCRTCSKVPIKLLTASTRSQSESGAMPPPADSPSPQSSLFDDEESRAFTASAFERTPCCCDGMVWICQPCGLHLKTADTSYLSGWNWRTQYTHYLGGVGEGAGEGNEGVNCGRGSLCLAAKVVEHEVEACEAPASSTSKGADRWTGTSYHAQEIEGVGGGFKMKAKKQVRVGECVKFYEKERTSKIEFLEKEVNGKLRSWCAWCERVIPGERDRAEGGGYRPPSSSASSASSG